MKIRKPMVPLVMVLGLGLLLTAGKGGKKSKDEGKDPAGPEKAPTAAEVVESIQAFYESTLDFQASFSQVYKNKLYDEEKKSTGKVYLKRPGKMRWEYKKPTEKLFVSDGKTLWVYEAEPNQVFKQDLASSDLPTAISFLMGEGDLEKDFTYKLVPNEKAKQKGMIVLELVPVVPSTQYKKLLFMVDDETFEVKRTIVIDQAGNTNSMRFEKVKTNQGIPDKKFDFKMPKGATLVTP